MTGTSHFFTTRARNRYLLIIALLVVFNIVVFNIYMPSGGYDEAGNFHKNPTNKISLSLMAFVVTFPAVGFAFGALAAVLPYRNLPYSQKYLRSSLLGIMVLNAVFAFVLLVIMFLKILKGLQ